MNPLPFTLAFGAIWFLLGASLFSFFNAAAYRAARGLSPAKGRSFCPGCLHTLGAKDLVPVFSFLLLRGKCRYCGAKIASRYVCMELLGGVCALLLTARYGADYYGVRFLSIAAALGIAVFGILAAIAIVDQATMEIPNGFVIALLVCALAAPLVFKNITLLERGIGFFSVSLPLFLITLFIPGAFGGGDIKLMAVSGLLLGWQMNLLALFLGVLTGGGYAAYLLLSKKMARGAHMAFGPYLCFGIAAALLWGEGILGWYVSLLI